MGKTQRENTKINVVFVLPVALIISSIIILQRVVFGGLRVVLKGLVVDPVVVWLQPEARTNGCDVGVFAGLDSVRGGGLREQGIFGRSQVVEVL